ncbi:MAG: hypothetical protein EA361_10750 [Bacteroidetes bacterium]|nr:MAG: hypothetical protein EA361_10750 [Bacteroidota bacterium]
MIRKSILSLFFLLPLLTIAQFTDDFSDGDFTQNPQWIGDTDKFIVENQMLRLNDNQAGEAYLATQSAVLNNTQWEFWVRIAFTPSNNNHPVIYLVSDSEDLSGPLNGYYIRIGKDGTDNKRLYFYRQTGETHTEILAGNTNIAPLSNNRIRIKATRDDTGNWEFFADPTGANFFLPQGTTFDNQHTSAQWFGVKCRYTVTNASGFYFDDFYVGEIIPDITPPQINSILATTENTLEVLFSKAVEPVTAQNVTNYFVNKGIGAPATAVRSDATPNKVTLTFSTGFVVGETYNITILNVKDFAGNTMAPFTGDFSWYIPQRFDVVFNEIMADPTPEVGLPPHEYVELFNTSAFEINLEGWTFRHGTTNREIPFAVIPAGGFLVLTSAGAIDELEGFGNVVAVPGLSATALTNSGATLTLWDEQGELVSFVSYADTWYDDPEKAGGGWSLEKIDPFNFCGGADNWRASTDPRGGTPGEENAVRDDNPDTTHPLLLGAAWENPLQITLYFSETMDEASLSQPDHYLVNNAHPLSVSVQEPDFNRAVLILGTPLESNTIYEVVLSEDITDCAGNPLAVNTAQFADYTVAPFDIVFNELMANPNPAVALPPYRYLELYNTSGFPIHLRGWTLTHGTTSRELPFIPIMPGGYAVISTMAGAAALEEFPNVYAVPGLSANFLTIGGVTLSLKSPQQQIVSFVSYNESWYGDASKANGGWALEKIDPFNFCGGSQNWKASVDPRGGTPGEPNSVMGNNPDTDSPFLLRAGYEAPNRISLFFNEPMDAETLTNTGNYSINNGIGQPLNIVLFAPENRRVDLVLPQPLSPETIYEVTVASEITDCAGNSLEGNRAKVGIPVMADSLDLVINEILFNPPDRGVRYVEIYNRSQKIIDLKNYILSSKDTLEGILTTIREISTESQLIFPGEYRVLTPNPEIVKNQFMTPNPLWFISMTLSSMTNTRGIVVLASKGQQITDMMIYHEDMHYALLTNKKGVALERLNYDRPTADRSNWHSAARNVGFGTPGYKNSQFTLNVDAGESVFEVYPRVFSPDNDGVDDVLNITYEMETPGFTANVTVYDSRGRHIRTLYRSELLATKGILTWDGTTDDYQKADMGIYIIFIELFEPGGTVKTYRKTAVLGGRL